MGQSVSAGRARAAFSVLGPAVFRAVAEFIDKTIFKNDVEFAGKVMFNKDTAGYAVIKENAQDVEVTFEQEYAVPPIVNATLSLQTIEDPEVRVAAEQLLLVSDVKYIITNVTTKGFNIKIDNQAISDIPFSWQAVAVKDAKTFKSRMTAADSGGLPLEIAPIDTSINTVPGETTPVVGNSDTTSSAPPEQAQPEVVGTNNVPASAVAGAENSAGNIQP